MTKHTLRIVGLVAVLLWGAVQQTDAQFTPPNPAFEIVQTGVVVQTIGTTPTVILEVPVGELKVVFLEAFIVSLEHTFAFGAVAKVEALFARITGNIGQVGTTRVDPIRSTFVDPQPQIGFVLDQTNKKIQVSVTGKTNMTIQWYLDLKIRTTR